MSPIGEDLSLGDWPLFGLQDDVRAALAALAEPAVLVTLIAARGGSPRELGAQMLVTGDAVTGYVSGGCVEADVARHARALLGDGGHKRLVYGEGGPMDVRLPCGGRVELLLERLDGEDEAARRLLLAFQTRIPALWLTDGDRRVCLYPGDTAPPAFLAAFEAAAAGGVCGEAEDVWFRRHDPAPRLIVLGADPPALAMAAMGAQAGLETTLIRPKGPTAPPPLPGVDYLRDDPVRGLARLGADRWTAVACASHDPELDDPAAAAALRAGAAYVGVLGARSKREARLERLSHAGVSPDQLTRLHAPIGLPLGGKSPWHIGAATLAQVIDILHHQAGKDAWPRGSAEARLDAIVLAAGSATRFGGGKLLAPLGEGVVLDGALAAAFAAPARRVKLVVGAEAEAVAAAGVRLADRLGQADRLDIVLAPDHALGLSASLKAGVRACAEADGVIIFLGDMPRVDHQVAGRLVEAIARGAPAAAAMVEARRGHPVVIARRLFPDLLALTGDAGAGRLLDRLGDALTLVSVGFPTQADIDTREDLDHAQGSD